MMTHIFFYFRAHTEKMDYKFSLTSQLIHQSKNIDFIKQQRATSSTIEN
jgi:hypothetical protein